MIIYKSIDIEEAVKDCLAEHLTAYCRPLPAEYDLPNILVQSPGGTSESTNTGKGKIDAFTVTLDARAKLESDALDYLRTAVAVLQASIGQHGISMVDVNSLYSWGTDPVRPDLAMCSATCIITAHRIKTTI